MWLTPIVSLSLSSFSPSLSSLSLSLRPVLIQCSRLPTNEIGPHFRPADPRSHLHDSITSSRFIYAFAELQMACLLWGWGGGEPSYSFPNSRFCFLFFPISATPPHARSAICLCLHQRPTLLTHNKQRFVFVLPSEQGRASLLPSPLLRGFFLVSLNEGQMNGCYSGSRASRATQTDEDAGQNFTVLYRFFAKFTSVPVGVTIGR